MLTRLHENPDSQPITATDVLNVTRLLSATSISNINDLIDYEVVRDIIHSFKCGTKPSVLHSYGTQKTTANDIEPGSDSEHTDEAKRYTPNLPVVPAFSENQVTVATAELNQRVLDLNLDSINHYSKALLLLQLNDKYDVDYALTLLRVYCLGTSLDLTKPQ